MSYYTARPRIDNTLNPPSYYSPLTEHEYEIVTERAPDGSIIKIPRIITPNVRPLAPIGVVVSSYDGQIPSNEIIFQEPTKVVSQTFPGMTPSLDEDEITVANKMDEIGIESLR